MSAYVFMRHGCICGKVEIILTNISLRIVEEEPTGQTTTYQKWHDEKPVRVAAQKVAIIVKAFQKPSLAAPYALHLEREVKVQ